MSYADSFEERVKLKKGIAKKIYKLVFTCKKDRDNNVELLSEILEQIEVCEEMCCPISIGKIEEWIVSKDIRKIRIEAWKIKFAS